jgi:NAD(P)-dependent dehydrogenase (short-subunit alcohol dehydrogenase family)
VLDVNEEGARQVAKDIGGLAVRCDVADAASAVTAVHQAAERHGPARVLVNCAGGGPAARVVGREGPMKLDAFRRVIEINLIGTFNMIRLVAAGAQELPPLADGERGVIVSTASVAAYDGQIGQAAYSASKGGIVAMVLPIARELARAGIRVNAIAPGLFATPMLLTMPQNVQDSLAAQVPFPSRFGQPEEYARLAMHIVENAMLNGECIRLDGAIRMQPK